MAKFDHRFWEIPVEPSALESVLAEPDFLAGLLTGSKDVETLERRADQQEEMVVAIRTIIETHLTDKQRAIVQLYFFEQKTQQEIASTLGLPQQVVSKHLFGVMRNGRKVGGAITKIQKIASRLGIDPKKWV